MSPFLHKNRYICEQAQENDSLTYNNKTRLWKYWKKLVACWKTSLSLSVSFRFAKKKKGKQKVLSLQKVNQRREVNYR